MSVVCSTTKDLLKYMRGIFDAIEYDYIMNIFNSNQLNKYELLKTIFHEKEKDIQDEYPESLAKTELLNQMKKAIDCLEQLITTQQSSFTAGKKRRRTKRNRKIKKTTRKR